LLNTDRQQVLYSEVSLSNAEGGGRKKKGGRRKEEGGSKEGLSEEWLVVSLFEKG
jgi:hypothetical protein